MSGWGASMPTRGHGPSRVGIGSRAVFSADSQAHSGRGMHAGVEYLSLFVR